MHVEIRNETTNLFIAATIECQTTITIIPLKDFRERGGIIRR